MKSRPLIYNLAFVLYLLFLIKVILLKDTPVTGITSYIANSSRDINLMPFDTIKLFLKARGLLPISDIIANLLGNVVIFMPLGIYLKPIGSRITVIMLIVLSSLFLESLQYLTGLGHFDVDDILLNTIGGIIGALVLKAYLIRKDRLVDNS